MAFNTNDHLNFYGETRTEKAAELLERSRDASDRVQKAVGRALGQQHRMRSSIKTNKSMATRERIMQAAAQLIQKRGGTNFQMSEVSEACHMSKGALYYYFCDKDDLVNAVFDAELQSFAQAVSTATLEATSSMEALMGLCAVFEGRLCDGAALALGMIQQLMHYHSDLQTGQTSNTAAVVEVLARQIERAKSEGMVRPDVDATRTAIWTCGAFTFDALSGTSKAVSSAGTRSRSARLVHQLLEGIGTPEGIEALGNIDA